jgi:hypothetical protein
MSTPSCRQAVAIRVAAETYQPVPCPELILFRRLAGADEVAQSLVRFIRNPNRSEITGTMAACQFFRIATACLYQSPAFTGTSVGATTWHSTPMAVSCQ